MKKNEKVAMAIILQTFAYAYDAGAHTDAETIMTLHPR